MKNKFITEFIGTFLLYLIIGLCVFPPGTGKLTPLAIGIGLAAIVYSIGHISKAHFNPAITFAFLTTKTLPKKELLPYLIAEFLSVACAAAIIGYLKPDYSEWLTTLPALETPKLILVETIFTFALAWVILNVAIAKGTEGNQFYGLAIGAIVAAGAFTVGPISLAAFNPAVTFGFCINGIISWKMLPIYCVVQIAAGIAAGLLFNNMKLASE